MPRAHRHFVPGHIWHITHRCHKREFLLKFTLDRRRWLYWLFEAKKRYGLCVLNYIVTSNHIHLLVKDTDRGIIPASLQLIAGRTAQEYNLRKGRKGAFWEDRYHATAVESGDHLLQCITYIDTNMVRAGVVTHPQEWPQGGYRDIQSPPERYRIIDLDSLSKLCGAKNIATLQRYHRNWVDEALRRGHLLREARWSGSIAVGSEAFVRNIHQALGFRALHRQIVHESDTYMLKETAAPYGANIMAIKGHLSVKNTLKWNIF